VSCIVRSKAWRGQKMEALMKGRGGICCLPWPALGQQLQTDNLCPWLSLKTCCSPRSAAPVGAQRRGKGGEHWESRGEPSSGLCAPASQGSQSYSYSVRQQTRPVTIIHAKLALPK
jgi:hypothetical protein